MLARLVLSAFLTMGIMVFSLALYGQAWGESLGARVQGETAEAMRGLYRLGALALTVPVVGLLGVPLVDGVVRLGRWLSSESLVLSGVGAALAVSSWNALGGGGPVYFETVSMVLVLYTLGRWLESRAKSRVAGRLRRSLQQSWLATGGDREEIVPGQEVRVRPGDIVPVDGIVRSGTAQADLSLFLGEARPRLLAPGDSVLAGTVPHDGVLVVEATATPQESLMRRVEARLQEVLDASGPLVRMADRAAQWILPVVLCVALLAAFIRGREAGLEAGASSALAVVLVSCPCAFGLATPLAFWVALTAAWRRGILVRGAEVLERLAACRRVVFDKTGTLTEPVLELSEVETFGVSREEALKWATALEGEAPHPIAAAFRAAWEARGGGAVPRSEGLRLLAGRGVRARVEGRTLELVRADDEDLDGAASSVVLRKGGKDLARFRFLTSLRPEAPAVIAALRERGLSLSIATGDTVGATRDIARALGLSASAALLPDAKLEYVLSQRRGTVFVGDGLNDAAALAAADVGVTVAGAAPGTVERGAIHLERGGLRGLVYVHDVARRAVRVARRNLFWAFGYNALGLSAAFAGRLSPVMAAGLMLGSSVWVVLSSAGLARGLVSSESDSEPGRTSTHPSPEQGSVKATRIRRSPV